MSNIKYIKTSIVLCFVLKTFLFYISKILPLSGNLKFLNLAVRLFLNSKNYCILL